MNVSIVSASRTARPFIWTYDGQNAYTPGGTVQTATAIPSLGKLKETVWTHFQAFISASVAAPTATIQIQGTDDALTAFGVTIPVTLTNGSASATIPTTGYTLTVVDAKGQPTGQRTVSTATASSFYTVPCDTTSAIWSSPFVNVDQQIVSLIPGMAIAGVYALTANTVISSIAAGGQSLTLSNAYGGTTGTYLVNFSNNYWENTPLATISLSPAGLIGSDGATVVSPVKYVRANVTAVAGTNPLIQVWMGAQMDNLHYISLALNGVLLLLGYLMRTTIEANKQRVDQLEVAVKEQNKEIVEVKVHYLQKDDFSEFKNELWRKLDDLKATVGHAK